MDNATWCRTPTAVSAGRRLRPEVSKNSSTGLSSNEGESATSITTCAPVKATLSPSPVMMLIPLLGEAATTSWPFCRRMAAVFVPMRPVPPMTTIFIAISSSMSTFLCGDFLYTHGHTAPFVPIGGSEKARPLRTFSGTRVLRKIVELRLVAVVLYRSEKRRLDRGEITNLTHHVHNDRRHRRGRLRSKPNYRPDFLVNCESR